MGQKKLSGAPMSAAITSKSTSVPGPTPAWAAEAQDLAGRSGNLGRPASAGSCSHIAHYLSLQAALVQVYIQASAHDRASALTKHLALSLPLPLPAEGQLQPLPSSVRPGHGRLWPWPADSARVTHRLQQERCALPQLTGRGSPEPNYTSQQH